MLKSWLITFLIIAFFIIVYVFDLFAYLTSTGFYVLAGFMLISSLIASVIILGIPFKRKDSNDKTDE